MKFEWGDDHVENAAYCQLAQPTRMQSTTVACTMTPTEKLTSQILPTVQKPAQIQSTETCTEKSL